MNHNATQRVVALVDMDCFYCQVETRLNPSLKGKPVAVVQYNQWKGGGIIAVNYEARDCGVTRGMRGDDAKEKCPEIVLVSVPTIRGKADLSNYRDAGDEVAKVFSEFCDCVQRASIDEAYLDLTKAVEEYIKNEKEDLDPNALPNTFVVGYCDLKNKSEDGRKQGLIDWLKHVESQKTMESSDYKLTVGGIIVEKMRQEILNKTGFHCSAGIAHNKILAKLTAGLHKPKRQTILPQDNIPELYSTLPIYKVRNLGGKLGKDVSSKLSINYMSELYNFSLLELQQKFDEKTSLWLYNIARGIDLEPVTSRMKPESIGCCKNFTGKNNLTTKSEVEKWLTELATEISERLIKDLEKNKRRAKLLTVSFYQESPMSRCGALNSYETAKIVKDALELLKKFNNASPNEDVWNPPIKYLGLAASKFTSELASVKKYFENCQNVKNTEDALSKEEESNEDKNNEASCSFQSQHSENMNKSHHKQVKSKTQPQSSSSFFIEFLNKNRIKNLEVEAKKPEEDEDEENWVSLTEVFPDITQAEEDVVSILPEPMQKKLKDRLNSKADSGDESAENSNVENREEVMGDVNSVEAETCSECGKSIPLIEFLEHLDYHAALKLYSEINKSTCNSHNGVVTSKTKSKETESQNKRKKKGSLTPSKKMKSITSFFNVVPK